MRNKTIPCLLTLLLLAVAACQDSTTTTLPSNEPTTQPNTTDQAELDVDGPASEQDAMILIRFVESAPKDRFFIENISDCPLGETTVNINLAPSVGKLIFDTTESGAGVEVFQPFEITEGQMTLVDRELVNDGDSELTLKLTDLLPQSRVGFTIDVDDTLTESELGNIRVSNSEISGAIIRISGDNAQTAEAEFGTDSQAIASFTCDASTG